MTDEQQPATDQVAPDQPDQPGSDMAYGLASLPEAASPDAPNPTVRWLTEKKRVERHELAHPFIMDGIVYRAITVKRATAGEVAAFMERVRAAPDTTLRFPLFFHDGAEVSDLAWAALDDDDRFALETIADDFLPARFRRPTDGGPS